MDMDLRSLRDAFGTFMTGVTIVTCRDSSGQPVGFTANSFTSVSLDPPLVLVCLANSSSNYETMTSAQSFAVNILSEDQKDISNTFARPSDDRFATVNWQPGPNGSPILADVSAWFDCDMHKITQAGDHAILIGRVKGFEATQTPGLGYARGAYFTPSLEAALLERPDSRVIVSALIENHGKVLMLEDDSGDLMIPQALVDKQGASTCLEALTNNAGLNTAPGFIYSVYEDPATGNHNICFLCHASDGQPKIGTFLELDSQRLESVSDLVLRGMLTRFCEESHVGNFGIYFGDRETGEIRQLNPDRQTDRQTMSP